MSRPGRQRKSQLKRRPVGAVRAAVAARASVGTVIVLVAVLVIALFGVWRHVTSRPGDQRREPGEITLITGGPTTQAAAPGVTTTQPEAGAAARPPVKWSPPRFAARRRGRDAMVRDLREDYGLTDRAVLSAMAAVPRHEFVPPELSGSAYDDRPQDIGYGQTISQPLIVAEMTRLLKLKPDSRVLEIGTGSGYQAAVLTEFTPHVYTMEIIKPLAVSAGRRLTRLGYRTVRVAAGDGYFGWPQHAPFDAIIVTCAAGQVPPPLIKQLARGGRMVIPVGAAWAQQSLMLVEKDERGWISSRSLMLVAFVPLLREDTSAK